MQFFILKATLSIAFPLKCLSLNRPRHNLTWYQGRKSSIFNDQSSSCDVVACNLQQNYFNSKALAEKNCNNTGTNQLRKPFSCILQKALIH